MKSDRIFALFLATYLSLALLGKFAFKSYLGELNLSALLYALTFSLTLFLGYNSEKRFNLPFERAYVYLILSILVSSAAGILGVVAVFSRLFCGVPIIRRSAGGGFKNSSYDGKAFAVVPPPLAKC